jgi:hypothetical protein
MTVTIIGTVMDYNTTAGLIVLEVNQPGTTAQRVRLSVRPLMARDPERYAAILSSVSLGSRIRVDIDIESRFLMPADHVEVLV